MYGVSTAIVLQFALCATTGSEYRKAYDEAAAAGKPLLVLVGTEQSPAYRVMREETLPALNRAGGLEDVVYTEVDAEAKPQLTRQLVRGTSVPQLVLYTPMGKQWRRTHLSGAHSEDGVRGFLKRQIANSKEAAERLGPKRKTVAHSPSKRVNSYSSRGS